MSIATVQASHQQQATAELQSAIALLSELCQARFFGKLTISFEGGTITLLRKEENIRPAEVRKPK